MPRQLRRWQIVSTVAVLVLAAVSSLLGLVRAGHYHGPSEIVEAYQVQDLTILVVGIPVIAAGLWYAVRDSPRGRIVWLGGLA
ncbi:hypothetical protein [Natrinema sp. 1APR25-10V2]|uniref:hypothetical protein n=1 Tax=Natrinema sp. 1APR25-10V2 TaxID=2951081 RepID=UPI002875F1CE|nr:hypothetical protein [Natrinema sp. 1APR25-10V2]MDS0473627.1 hypothetical protein [Natrinema sp. 1APR25-10V2]